MHKNTINFSYYRALVTKIGIPFLIVFGVALIYFFAMPLIDHQNSLFPIIVVMFVLIKTTVIFIVTLKQLSKLIRECYSLEKLVWTFGILIAITLFSFATDYTCIYQYDQNAFNGLGVNTQSYFTALFHFFYFSVITFSTVGYGEIIPISNIARLVVICEIMMSFFIIIFALSNIKKMHID